MSEAIQIKMRADLPDILRSAVQECRSPSITPGATFATGCLERIALRAIEIGDVQILDELVKLGLVKGD